MGSSLPLRPTSGGRCAAARSRSARRAAASASVRCAAGETGFFGGAPDAGFAFISTMDSMCSRRGPDQDPPCGTARRASGEPPAATQHLTPQCRAGLRREGAPSQGSSEDATMNYLRTAILLAGLTALFMGVGYLIGGGSGALIALLVAAGMNLASYWNADKLVLAMHEAREVNETTAPDLVQLVAELARRAGLSMPRVYVMDNPQPTRLQPGRNPEHAAVAVATGLLQMLSRE